MQDESLEASTSISQLLRESYLAERTHNGNSEQSRSDSLHPLCCGNSAGLSEEAKGLDDFSDLSAFLSQEELDKSVNLAIQEIDQSPLETTRNEHQKHVTYPAEELSETPKSSSKQAHQLAYVPASSEKDHRPESAKLDQGNVRRATDICNESSPELKKPQSNSPYCYEKESKKEFIHKAADFIEELSSIFKIHNSKNIRPKTCKKYRRKRESKSTFTQGCSSDYTNLSENRERLHNANPVEAVEVEGPLTTLKNEEVKHLENARDLKITEISESSPTPVDEPILQPPNFIQKLKSREILEGAKVQLDCVVVGIPFPEVRWYCEGKELENSPDIQIIQAGNVQSLIISEAFQEDTGRYSCFASNICGTDSTSAEIYIEGASSSESEGDLNKEDMDQSLSDPPPPLRCLVRTSTWVPKSTSEIDDKAVFSTNLSSSVIHQEVPKEEHTAESAIIQEVPSIPVQPQSQSPTNYLQGLDGRPLIAAPVFTKMLQDLSASEGQLIVFECRVKGAPSPKVEWYREGSLIEDSPDFRILQKKPRSMAEPEEMCTLVIAEVFPEDSGTFTCTANNKYGTVSSIAHLNVRDSQDSSCKAALTTSTINVEDFKHQTIPSNPAYISSNPTYPLLDAPTKLKLEGVLVNHNEPRPSSKVGLRVHFKLPENDRGSEVSSEEVTMTSNQLRSDMAQEIIGKSLGISGADSLLKEPPPVLAKPKLGPVQLQLLHNQVLLEQQQLQPSSPQHISSDMSFLNTFSSPIQQSISTANQQTKLAPPETFTYARPKVFLDSQQTKVLSPSSSAILTPSSISETTESSSAIVESVLTSSLPSFSSHNRLEARAVSQKSKSPTLRIQDPAAFLSSVLPSLPPAQPPTNYMGLPRRAPTLPSLQMSKITPKALQLDLVHDKEAVIGDLKRKLYFKDDLSKYQQRATPEKNMVSRHQGLNKASSVFLSETVHSAPSQEYKISNFEQRLMNEIEFRLERTPVDESDEEVQHDEIPTGKCIAPIFDKRLKHFRAMEGTAVTFTCKVVGIPIPKVYWFKDGKQISKKYEHCKMKRESDGTCMLHIEAATNDDDGNYTIMAANPQGKISCSGHLLVQTAPTRVRLGTIVHSHRVRSRIQEAEGEPVQDHFFRPHFLQAPGDMVAHEGRLCRLDCKVSGLPTPDLLWLLNGKPILPDVTHKMLIRENGIHSLIIDPLMQKDAGTYTCIATNKTGQHSFNLELNVVAKEIKKSPVFLEKLQNSGVPEGHPVRLESRVVGMPPPLFYWKKDNETIPCNDQRVSMHQDTTGYVCLFIQPTKKDDAGWYTLSAKNDAGIASCTARLDIYAQWYQQIPQPIKKVRSSGSRYATLTGQGLDILSAFPSVENPVEFSSSSQDIVESEEL